MDKYIDMVQKVRAKLLIQYRYKRMNELAFDIIDNQLWDIVKAMMDGDKDVKSNDSTADNNSDTHC